MPAVRPLGGEVRHADQAREARPRRLGVVKQVQRGVDRVEEAVEVQRGRRGRTDADRTPVDQDEPGAEHRGEPDELGEVEPGEEAGDDVDAPQAQVAGRLGALLQEAGVGAVQPEGTDGPDPADAVEQLVLQRPGGDPVFAVDGRGAAQVPAHREHLDRRGEQRREEEAPVQHGESGEGERDREGGAAELGQRLAHRLADHRHVAGDPGDQVAGTGRLDAVERQPQGPLDELLAQGGQYGLAEPCHQGAADGGGAAAGHRDDDQQGQREGERGRAAVLHHQVDDVPEQGSGQQSDGGPAGQDGERGHGEQPVAVQHAAERGERLGAGGRGQQLPVGGPLGAGRAHGRVRPSSVSFGRVGPAVRPGVLGERHASTAAR